MRMLWNLGFVQGWLALSFLQLKISYPTPFLVLNFFLSLAWRYALTLYIFPLLLLFLFNEDPSRCHESIGLLPVGNRNGSSCMVRDLTDSIRSSIRSIFSIANSFKNWLAQQPTSSDIFLTRQLMHDRQVACKPPHIQQFCSAKQTPQSYSIPAIAANIDWPLTADHW